MPDPDESRRFADIVSRLGAEDARFATPAQARARTRSHRLFLAGLVLCLLAGGLIAFGGVKGAVLAAIPWILGIILVVRGRSGPSA
jgi:MFS superfamily sulfate permease-like transporter